MAESQNYNPYAPPQSTHLPTAAKPRTLRPVLLLVVMTLVFSLLRSIGFGFIVLISLVQSSGTEVHWRNVIPMLMGILLGFFVMHWIEWKWCDSKVLFLLLAFSAYLAGAVVATIAGYFDFFPNPF